MLMHVDTRRREDEKGSRILFISYHFPPSAAVGGLRTANFARYLPLFGWKPYVLTINDTHIEAKDPERLRGLEGVSIFTARVLPTALRLFTAATRALQLLGNACRSSEPAAVADVQSLARRRENFTRRVHRYVLSFLVVPDFETGWILPALMQTIRQVRRNEIDWILTSCPPYSAHVVGLFAKKLTRRKWVADFRDPWMTAEAKQLYPTSALSLKVDSWLERLVVDNSDLLVFNVERLRNAYSKRYSHQPPEKFVFIPNGIPTLKTLETGSVNKYDKFTLTYTGSLYAGRTPEPVFKALSALIKTGKAAPEELRVRLVGYCRHVDGLPLSSLLARYELESIVEVQDSVPQTEAWDILRRSHLALLLAPGLPFQIPAKVYDYLAVGTRILAIAEDGATADLVTDSGCGRAFAPSDINGLSEFIRSEMATQSETNGQRSAFLTRFDVRTLTEQLVCHLARVDAEHRQTDGKLTMDTSRERHGDGIS